MNNDFVFVFQKKSKDSNSKIPDEIEINHKLDKLEIEKLVREIHEIEEQINNRNQKLQELQECVTLKTIVNKDHEQKSK